MKSYRRIMLAFAGIILLVGMATLAAWQFRVKAANPGNKVRVVAAENFWGNIASQIGGDHVQVSSIITDPSADPHLYESDAAAAGAVASANIVIKNGLGYDDFTTKLLAGSTNPQRQGVSVNQVLNVSGSDPNPHLWYDLPRVPRVAEAIEAALIAQDPTHQEDYAANLKRFEDSMQPLLTHLDQIKAQFAGTPVTYTERVPEYLLAAGGLSVKSPPGFARAIEDGNDPSPADTAAMDALLTSHRVRVLLYNAQTTSPVTQQVRALALAGGIPVVGVTETLPRNEPTYQHWQLDQIMALQTALESGK